MYLGPIEPFIGDILQDRDNLFHNKWHAYAHEMATARLHPDRVSSDFANITLKKKIPVQIGLVKSAILHIAPFHDTEFSAKTMKWSLENIFNIEFEIKRFESPYTTQRWLVVFEALGEEVVLYVMYMNGVLVVE